MRILAMAIFAAAVGGTALVAAPTARAVALPTCNRTYVLDNESAGPIEVPSVGTSPVNTSCVLGRGARGRAVTRLQVNLNVCYRERLAVDGIFGPGTEAALKRAQAVEGTAADGIYGPQTRDRLRWAGGNPWGCWQVNGPGGF